MWLFLLSAYFLKCCELYFVGFCFDPIKKDELGFRLRDNFLIVKAFGCGQLCYQLIFFICAIRACFCFNKIKNVESYIQSRESSLFALAFGPRFGLASKYSGMNSGRGKIVSR